MNDTIDMVLQKNIKYWKHIRSRCFTQIYNSWIRNFR